MSTPGHSASVNLRTSQSAKATLKRRAAVDRLEVSGGQAVEAGAVCP